MQIKKETVTKFLRKDLLLWNFSNLLWNYQIAVGNFSLNDKLAFAKPVLKLISAIAVETGYISSTPPFANFFLLDIFFINSSVKRIS